ncbi:MAG: Hsp20 family protein [Pseudomonadales bacterium]|nr:Hsp20 family protein [Pseudomonadales bacterium]
MQASLYAPYVRKHQQPFSFFDSAFVGDSAKTYSPAYNLVADKEHHFVITLSVPGFEKSELDIQLDENVLVVRGKNKTNTEEIDFLHCGFVKRDFVKHFRLEKNIKIADAQLTDGLLHINLMKEIPEELKPISITINSANEG